MEDKRVVSTQEIGCTFSPLARNSCARSTDGQDAEPRTSQEKLPHVEAVHAGGFITAKCISTVSIID